jgi:hypothetical protein
VLRVRVVVRGVSLFAWEGSGIEGVYGDTVGLDELDHPGLDKLDHRKPARPPERGLDGLDHRRRATGVGLDELDHRKPVRPPERERGLDRLDHRNDCRCGADGT